MLFNSIDFAIFLPIVFFLYWFAFRKNLTGQNILLLTASYVFYGWWDWRFLSLIIFSSLVDFIVGRKLGKTTDPKARKALLWVSIIVNIGFLGVFKYFNFFSESFAEAFSLFGKGFDPFRLNIILPVGISFYTFQTLSYTIDVYRRNMEPTDNIIRFFTFVSFFPQLVAGPIERASNLLPQFAEKRKFNYLEATDGMRQVFWGLFKKVVIADTAAIYVNDIFSNYQDLSGGTLFFGGVLFAFQIYGDFSGYSDIAIGVSRLFGFNLMRNFAFPYFSRDIAEFWRRWHISLSTWFRDYLYIPLGGSKGGNFMRIRNTFIIFIVSGFWHGANWTFIIWGLLNAIYFLPLLLTGKNRSNLDIVAKGKLLPSFKDLFHIMLTFVLTVFAWIFFRSDNVTAAGKYIYGIFTRITLPAPEVSSFLTSSICGVFIFFLLFEWWRRDREHAFRIEDLHPLVRRFIYLVVFVFIFMYGKFGNNEFIYFQF